MPRPCCLPAPLTDGGCPGSEWHERGEAPVDPIVLIKTRYSAFAYCLPEYIRATTSESGPEFDPRTEEWDAKLVDFCKTYSFRKLSGDVLGVSIEECRFWSPLRSNVLFKARMMSDDNKLIEFWERAVLTRESEDQGWKYHKGNLLEYTGPLY
jgi:SEC-C motif-containing protein